MNANKIKGFENVNGFFFRRGKPADKNAKKLRKALNRAIIREATMRDAFYKDLEAHGVTAARKRASRYFKSVSGRMLAAANMNKRRPLDKRISLAECWELARNLKVHKPIDEQVHVFFKQKSNGGKRPIFDFGLKHRAAQQLVRRLIESQLSPKPWQYTYTGVQNAIANVKLLDLNEAMWAANLDIKNFYGSFVDDKVVKLLTCLPSRVVMNVVLTDDMMITNNEGSPLSDSSLQEARPGVPQGSAVSPLVGVLAVSQLDLELPSGVWFANYADDFLIIAPNKENLEIAIQALVSAVAELPGGNFYLEEKGQATLQEGVEYLGHLLRFDGDKLAVEASQSALSKLWKKLEEKKYFAEKAKSKFFETHSEADRIALLSIIAEIFWLRVGWLAAFSECDKIFTAPIGDHLQYTIENLRSGTDIGIDELKAAEQYVKIDFSGSASMLMNLNSDFE